MEQLLIAVEGSYLGIVLVGEVLGGIVSHPGKIDEVRLILEEVLLVMVVGEEVEVQLLLSQNIALEVDFEESL